jgi:hypothetical protein
VRILAVAFMLVFAAAAAASCQQPPNDQQLLDATLDQSAPTCTTSKDCTGGLECSYESFGVGCKAKGECRDFSAEAGTGVCAPATTACGCDGKLVHIPSCWMGFAPVPVLATGQLTCGDASGDASGG